MIFDRERRENEIEKHSRTIDNFLRLNKKPYRQDIIIGLGNNDNRTALRAGQLYLDHYAPLMLLTGGIGTRTNDPSISEARRFLNIISSNYPQINISTIILETEATNTGQNVTNSRTTLEKLSIRPSSVLVVTKPFAERRAFYTFLKQWPQLRDLNITSAQYPFEGYFDDQNSIYFIAKQLVNEIFRLHIYQKSEYNYIHPTFIPQHIDSSCVSIIKLLPKETFQLDQLRVQFNV